MVNSQQKDHHLALNNVHQVPLKQEHFHAAIVQQEHIVPVQEVQHV